MDEWLKEAPTFSEGKTTNPDQLVDWLRKCPLLIKQEFPSYLSQGKMDAPQKLQLISMLLHDQIALPGPDCQAHAKKDEIASSREQKWLNLVRGIVTKSLPSHLERKDLEDALFQIQSGMPGNDPTHAQDVTRTV